MTEVFHNVYMVCPDCGDEIFDDVPELSEEEEGIFFEIILEHFYSQSGVMRQCKYCGNIYPYFPHGIQYDCCLKDECVERFNAEQYEISLAKIEQEKKDKLSAANKKSTPKEMQVIQTEPKVGYVYLMHSENGMYKIGIAKNIKSRLSDLNRQVPIRVEVIHYFASLDYRKCEMWLHKKFSDKRVKYEWFDLNAEQVREITKIQDFELDPALSILETP